MSATATIGTVASGHRSSAAQYRAKTMAIAAMIPEWTLQNIAHPHKKPASGENASRRNTYMPPVSGNAEASSAQTSAPNSVSTPQSTHAVMIEVGVAR